jgi:hypothetical protein
MLVTVGKIMGSGKKNLIGGIFGLLLGGVFLFVGLNGIWNEIDFRLNGVPINGLITSYERRGCVNVQYQTIAKTETFEAKAVGCNLDASKFPIGSPISLVYIKDNPNKVATEGNYSIGFFPITLTLFGSLICFLVSWYRFFFRSPSS